MLELLLTVATTVFIIRWLRGRAGDARQLRQDIETMQETAATGDWAGFGPDWALWANQGFVAHLARPWRDAGYGPELAFQLIDQGARTPEEARELLAGRLPDVPAEPEDTEDTEGVETAPADSPSQEESPAVPASTKEDQPRFVSQPNPFTYQDPQKETHDKA
jgi:hypothetical protein